MLKRDSILKAIRHESDSVVPFCIQMTWETINAYGERLLHDYPNKDVQDDLKAGKIGLNEAVYLSIGNFMFPAPFPWWGWDNANMPAEYSDPFAVPEVMPPILKNYDYPPMFEKTKYVRDKYGVYMTALVWGSHWEKAYFTRGIENMLADFAGSPEFVEELLAYIIKNNMEALDILLKCPDYDGVLLGSDWGTQKDLIMSPAMWRSMIAPGENKEYKVIKEAGKQIFIHSCGCILKVLPDLCEMGIDVLNPVQPECMDLAFLKREYGDKLTFWGGISTQKTLPYGTVEEVRRESARVIRLMSEGGGYITNSSQDIQNDVPYENLRALIDTAREFAGLN